MTVPEAPAARWALVLPVKRLELAKTRLTRFAGQRRPDLALAFALDTAEAVLGCPSVRGLLVVTDDDRAASELAGIGAAVVDDEPDAGLNPALLHGAAQAGQRWPGASVATVSSDLPALRGSELTLALELASGHPVAFVADAEGTGTTLLAATEPGRFTPLFGHRSRAAHRTAGIAELAGPGLESLRRDVDTEVDVHDARRIGLGPRSAALVAELLAARLG